MSVEAAFEKKRDIPLFVDYPHKNGSEGHESEGHESRKMKEAKNAIERAETLGRLMRQMGSLLLVLASLSFLVQRWDVLDHVTRYFSFLGFTLVMAAAGIFCGVGIKESKGARTLLALVVAIAPVHFAQLGALLFSKFGAVLSPEHYPALLRWTAPSEFAAIGTVSVALLVLTPLLYLAYSTLDRNLARRLTFGAVAANALLLIPNRDPAFVTLISLAAVAGVTMNESVLRSMTQFRTFENRLARFTLFVPIGVLFGRQMALYSCSSGLVAVALFCLAALLFMTIPRYTDKAFGDISQGLSCLPLIIGWGFMLDQLGFGRSDLDWKTLPAFGIPLVAIMLAMSGRAGKAASVIHALAAGIALATSALELSAYPGLFSSAYSLMTVVMLFAVALAFERKLVLALALFGAIHSLAHHIRFILEACDFSLWITLGGTGVVTIVAASLLERHYASLLSFAKNARSKVSAWEV